MRNTLIIREIRDAQIVSGAKLCIYIGKPEANLVYSLYLLYVSKKRGYIYVLKLVPTVSGNGSKKREITSVGARLSTFVFRRYYQPCRTHRCRKTRNSAAQSRLRSSAQGLLFLLCALHPLISLNTEASVAKVCV